MENKDLIAIYVTILMGALTAATVVVALLKEELLGKSFQEIIKKLGGNDQDKNQGNDQDKNQGNDQDKNQGNDQDKNQENPIKKDIKFIILKLLGKSFQEIIKKLGGNDQDKNQGNDQDKNQENPIKKDIKFIILNMILFAGILIFIVIISATKFLSETGALNGFLELLLIVLIISFVIFITRIYTYLYLIYSEIIEIKKGKNIFHEENQQEIEKDKNIFEKVFRKVFGIQKYIKYNNEKWQNLLGELVIESIDPAHYELLSVIIENNCEGDFLKDILEKTEIDDLNNISLDDYLCRKRIIIVNKSSRCEEKDKKYKFKETDYKLIGYNFKKNSGDLLDYQKFLEDNNRKYFIEGITTNLKTRLRNKKSLHDIKDDFKKMHELYIEMGKDIQKKIAEEFLKNTLEYPEFVDNDQVFKEIVNFIDTEEMETYYQGYSDVTGRKLDNDQVISFPNELEFIYIDDFYSRGEEIGYSYLYHKNEKSKNKKSDWYKSYIDKFELKDDKLDKLLEIADKRIAESDEEDKRKIEEKVKEKNLDKSVSKEKYPNLYNHFFGVQSVLKLILSHFAVDVNEVNVNDKVNEIMESDHRIIKIKNPIVNEIGGILSAKVTSRNNPKGIRFFYEVIQPNKKPEDFDHIYFAGNDIGEVFNRGIFRYDKTEGNYRIKMNLKEIKDDFSTIVATEILKNSESEETFIKELKSKLKKIADEYKDKKGNTPEN